MKMYIAIAVSIVAVFWGIATVQDSSMNAGECPVTLPGEGFTAPKPYPANPSVKGTRTDAWYGTEELWTILPVNGEYGLRKSVWWSTDFPGGVAEEKPPISVTWERLDVDAPILTAGDPGTNAHTAAHRWFMIAGIDPDEPGCWRVTAEYKGATLSYVYERA